MEGMRVWLFFVELERLGVVMIYGNTMEYVRFCLVEWDGKWVSVFLLEGYSINGCIRAEMGRN